ncbi:mviN [Wigglesworthia glossinidia endosymbiont of Glossina brevipalpis]|uniref:Probable lipid II flippase MurJ n=1 Tax=Wigglesworthia glossinidia brevipalpis TaxID=36870 RepID=Q8D371_WIGBR|nr:mviN [Wigglesworthia glossinidia endosymbiont of Glossina brevipalpis]
MKISKIFLMSSVMTFISRVFGFIRDVVIASIFGTGIYTDSFFVSFRIPNLLRRIFAEGAFSQIFIPILVKYRNNLGDEKAKIFASCIFKWLSLFLILITMVGIIISPEIVMLIAPGFINNTDQFVLTVSLLRILFPYIILISLSSLLTSILNSWNYFFISFLSPVFLNISIIFFSLYIVPLLNNNSIIALSWAVLIGGSVQLFSHFLYLRYIGIKINNFQLYQPDIKKIFILILPAVFGASVNQLLISINTAISSFLSPGSISWMYYADRIVEFPIGIFGASITGILLPLLSESVYKNQKKKYSDILHWSIKICFFLILPSSLILLYLSKPLVITLFKYKNFSNFDVFMTQKSLIGYSIGLTGLILVKIFTLSFYSIQNFKTPIYIAIISIIISQFMNLILVKYFQHAGLSLSIGITSYINAFLLYLNIKKRLFLIKKFNIKKFFMQLLFGLTIMFLTIFYLSCFIKNWEYGNIFFRLFRICCIIFISVTMYFFSLFLIGFNFKKIFNISHYKN